jgi:hypothetical protein
MSSLSNYGELLVLDITTASVGGNTSVNTQFRTLYMVTLDKEGGGIELTDTNDQFHFANGAIDMTMA